MDQVVLGLTGHIAAGKGAAAEHFKTVHHASLYRFSNMLRDILNRLFLSHSRENLQNISTVIRSTFGEDTMAHVIAKEIEADQNNLIIIDGVRRMADVTTLKRLPNFYLIGITAEPKIRFQRIVERNENSDDTQKTYEEFLHDEKQETEVLIDDIIIQSDYVIENNDSLESFQEQLTQLLHTIHGNKG